MNCQAASPAASPEHYNENESGQRNATCEEDRQKISAPSAVLTVAAGHADAPKQEEHNDGVPAKCAGYGRTLATLPAHLAHTTSTKMKLKLFSLHTQPDI
jgi:hypothetical protein